MLDKIHSYVHKSSMHMKVPKREQVTGSALGIVIINQYGCRKDHYSQSPGPKSIGFPALISSMIFSMVQGSYL